MEELSDHLPVMTSTVHDESEPRVLLRARHHGQVVLEQEVQVALQDGRRLGASRGKSHIISLFNVLHTYNMVQRRSTMPLLPDRTTDLGETCCVEGLALWRHPLPSKMGRGQKESVCETTCSEGVMMDPRGGGRGGGEEGNSHLHPHPKRLPHPIKLVIKPLTPR